MKETQGVGKKEKKRKNKGPPFSAIFFIKNKKSKSLKIEKPSRFFSKLYRRF